MLNNNGVESLYLIIDTIVCLAEDLKMLNRYTCESQVVKAQEQQN